MKIAIIGAGITGLSAAYRLTRRIADGELPRDTSVAVFDRRERVGGVLETVVRDGYQIEQSADNFITTVPYAIDLCRELGLESDLVQTNAAVRRTYVVHKNRLHLLPDGFLMMAPTKLLPLATTPILSPLGKLRAGLELFLPARRSDDDETMTQFVTRRLGREVFERLVEPLVSGVYAADMDKLSVLATLPRFREMERTHRSLILAMRAEMLRKRRAGNTASESGARYSMFVTLRSGLSHLCETLASRLPDGSVKTGCDVTKIKRQQNPVTSKTEWLVQTKNGTNEVNEFYDNVIIASPANEAAKLLTEALPEISTLLRRIEHQGTAIVTLAFRSEQVKQKLNGMGFVVPKIENNPILAGSFSSLKYEHRAPAGGTLIRLFAGGARSPNMADMTDEKLVPLLTNELKRIVKIEGDPLWSVTAHWSQTMPQYHVHYKTLIQELETELKKEPTIKLAGNYFNGVGIPQCINAGKIAAEEIFTDVDKDRI
jgi:oxygen-dependent protoporphyrinogen oxidase